MVMEREREEKARKEIEKAERHKRIEEEKRLKAERLLQQKREEEGTIFLSPELLRMVHSRAPEDSWSRQNGR